MSDEERNINPADMPPLPPADASEGAPAGTPAEESGAGFTETTGPGPETVGAQAFDTTPKYTPPAGAGVPPTGAIPPAHLAASDDDRLMAALAWVSMVILQIPLVSVVLLLAEGNKDRPFQRYHAITSILFWVAMVVYEVLAAIAFTLLSLVSFGCLALCLWIIFFVPHVIAIWYTVQAYQGRYPEIPFISQLARDQHWV
jgi:uncharacterized membrane protein